MWRTVGVAVLALSCTAQAPLRRATPVESDAAAAAAPARAPVVLTIVGGNDLHGHVERLPAFAGYVERLRALRKQDGAVVLLDAGDMFQGTLESNLSEGRAVIESFNFLGYSAAAIGNHDFDYGPEGDVEPSTDSSVDRRGALKARLRDARFPMLSANLTEGGKTPRWDNLWTEPAVLDVAGVRLGIVGGLTEQTPRIVMPAYFAGLEVTPLAEGLARQARRARELGARVVVASVHAGGDCKELANPRDAKSCDPEQEIWGAARALEPGLIDAIFAGHTHKAVAHFVSGIAVVESYALGTHFSRVDITVPPDPNAPLAIDIHQPEPVCTQPEGECIPHDYEGAPIQASAELAKLLDPYRDKARDLREQPLGVDVKVAVEKTADRESPLGNLLCDLLLEATPGADVSVVNGGSLRAPLPAGPLQYGELYETQPFDNMVAVVKLTGADLERVLAAHFSHGGHGIVSLGGLRLRTQCEQGALAVELLRANGKVVGDTEKLTLVTSDYLATGGDALFTPLGLDPKVIDIRTETVRDALARRLRARGGTLDGSSRALFDPKRPRLLLPSERPVKCVR